MAERLCAEASSRSTGLLVDDQLMTNHVHWVRVPRSAEALQRVLRPVHRRYAQGVNRERGWKGHLLWQGCFFSSPLDEAYLWAAIRYVECHSARYVIRSLVFLTGKL